MESGAIHRYETQSVIKINRIKEIKGVWGAKHRESLLEAETAEDASRVWAEERTSQWRKAAPTLEALGGTGEELTNASSENARV